MSLQLRSIQLVVVPCRAQRCNPAHDEALMNNTSLVDVIAIWIGVNRLFITLQIFFHCLGDVGTMLAQQS